MSCAKTQIKYVNPGMFLLRIYRYILLCFYCVDTETYCGSSEFKYLGTVAKNVCSIMLEICPTPNPTLNLPDSVNKCKTDIKTCLLMQPCHFNFLICRFELFCRTVITQDSNLSSSPPKYISVLRELPNKLNINENVSGYSRNPCSLNREWGAALSLHAPGCADCLKPVQNHANSLADGVNAALNVFTSYLILANAPSAPQISVPKWSLSEAWGAWQQMQRLVPLFREQELCE